ncbi:MAG: SpoIIE family protein phosphatase [Bacteroidota bacterium]
MSGYDELDQEKLLSVHCFTSGKSIFIQDYPDYLAKNGFSSYRGENKAKVQSALYTPLRLQNNVIGVLTVQSFKKNAYSERQLRTLEALGTYVSVALENSKVYQLIKDSNTRLTDSLRYALTIQQAILPTEVRLAKAFEEFLLIYRPKDIVSGDFYWFETVGSKSFFAVVDCTGHGVPGAFMSLIGYTLLNEIVNLEGIHEPHEILERLDEEVRQALRQDEGKNVDGMELSLCVLEGTVLKFAGAKSPMYIWHSERQELERVKGTRRAIGGRSKKSQHSFSTSTFELQKGDTLYLSSDGFIDQSSPDREKFGSVRYEELLVSDAEKNLAEQRLHIEAALDEHQNGDAQRDDITVFGVKIS